MCILIDHPEGHSFSDEWLADFYKKNSDGIGIMSAKDNIIYTAKMVPRNLDDFIQFYRERADGKACVLHMRFKTHGDIDLENCHPYEVFGEESGYPLYIMHNGVLKTGNAADITKSDTWHYIRDYIIPALKADPTQFMSEWFMAFVESHIGYNNKFAMMDAFGNLVIFNKDSGEMWGDVWMSNTYAWDAAKAGLIKSYSYGGVWNGKSYSNQYDDWDYPVSKNQGLVVDKTTPEKKPLPVNVVSIKDAPDPAMDFVKMFRTACKGRGMRSVNTDFYEDELVDYFEENGTQDAMALIQLIEEGSMTEAEIYDFMDNAYYERLNRRDTESQNEREISELMDDGRLKVGMI